VHDIAIKTMKMYQIHKKNNTTKKKQKKTQKKTCFKTHKKHRAKKTCFFTSLPSLISCPLPYPLPSHPSLLGCLPSPALASSALPLEVGP
jgi:hypothetical protein